MHLENEAFFFSLAAEIVPSESRPINYITGLADIGFLDMVCGQQITVVHRCAVAQGQRPVLDRIVTDGPPDADTPGIVRELPHTFLGLCLTSVPGLFLSEAYPLFHSYDIGRV